MARKRGKRSFGRVSCSTKAHKMSMRKVGARCVSVCVTPGGWKIPRFRKSSACKGSKARSWKSIRGGR